MIKEKYPDFYNALMNYNASTCAEAFNEWEEEDIPSCQKQALKQLEKELDKLTGKYVEEPVCCPFCGLTPVPKFPYKYKCTTCGACLVSTEEK